jgi:hypothetical protein
LGIDLDADANAAPRPGDAVLAAYVLSFPPTEAARMVTRVRCRLWTRYAAGRYSGAAYQAQAARLVAYIAQGNQTPEFKADSSAHGRMGAPLDGTLAAALMRHYGYSLNAALDEPRAMAWWLYLIYLETEGGGRIADETDRLARERAEEIRMNPSGAAAAQVLDLANRLRASKNLPPIKAEDLRFRDN